MSDSFKSLESAATGSQTSLDALLGAAKWNADGLIPAIAQQHDSGEVLMMAWMNRAALKETLSTHRVCYWSRSRQAFWRKGETSGQQQHLVEARFDCDGDTLLLKVDQSGPACHTGRRSCFYVKLSENTAEVDQAPLISPDTLYGKN
ncbi:phosphoribosyl-AMP cyclohydrolase [Salinicola rhizosphaerae]|uniref:Phosphoribosyl-AMP cyclohydrolase n=1 Tax=Salinicola rhizosphaerae TaxID=1443141 RepID=A0ABQ3DPD1_9GAMM|nr:phosphoribosyl-AMP cyclohydrolase [Salinicola rhizosphaerae]GHB09142.1 phosphoribosyl-AMP cyclohydrolase [Salinicola rhizosphaerae]